MSNKRYRLLKDLPCTKAGTIFIFDGYEYQAEDKSDIWKDFTVENTPDWFELIKEESPLISDNEIFLNKLESIVSHLNTNKKWTDEDLKQFAQQIFLVMQRPDGFIISEELEKFKKSKQ